VKYLALGVRIKALRERRGLSIEELAQKTGIVADKLLRIENDQEQPIIANLVLLSKALGVNVADIFRDKPPKSPFEVVRRADREKVRPLLKPSKAKIFDYTYELLTVPGPGKHMEAYLVEVPPRQTKRPSDDITHAGEEFMYVLEGTIEGMLGSESVSLSAGDTLYFRSTESHVFYNPHDTVARALVVIYPF
jgi:transcriptional regulator with XRE-family HTH domain